jgi:hypothetical protein
MEQKKKNNTPEEKKPQKKAVEKKAVEKKEEKPKGKNQGYLVVGIILILALFIIYLVFFAFPSATGASFPAFKSNLNAAPRIAVTVVFNSSAQFACAAHVVGILASTRYANTIDFSIINGTTCTYSASGLGHAGSVTTTNASSCLSKADGEPGIFLNYTGGANSTVITPYRMYVYGNASYYQTCSIVTEFG